MERFRIARMMAIWRFTCCIVAKWEAVVFLATRVLTYIWRKAARSGESRDVWRMAARSGERLRDEISPSMPRWAVEASSKC